MPENQPQKQEQNQPAIQVNAYTAQPGQSLLQKLLNQNSTGTVQIKNGAPLTKPSLIKTFYEEAEKSRAKTAKTVLWIAVAAALVVYGFFYSQLNPNFTLLQDQLGPNIASKFDRSNAELQKIQTDLNLTRYRMALLLLDEINGKIDPFERQTAIANSSLSTNAQKENALSELQIFGAEIKKYLTDVQKILNQPLGVDVYSREPVTPEQREQSFESALLALLAEQKSKLAADPKLNREEIRIVDNILRFVEDKKFRNLIRSQDLEKISEKDFGAMLAKIREQGTDELSAIDKIRKNRPNWVEVIQNIHNVTLKADPYYGHGLFKTVGGFLFNGYSFDSTTGRISIKGLTKTADSKTFSFIAKLIESIEKSPYFKDIDFRSFSKSRDDKGDYSSSFDLNFAIQTESDPRDDVINNK